MCSVRCCVVDHGAVDGRGSRSPSLTPSSWASACVCTASRGQRERVRDRRGHGMRRRRAALVGPPRGRRSRECRHGRTPRRACRSTSPRRPPARRVRPTCGVTSAAAEASDQLGQRGGRGARRSGLRRPAGVRMRGEVVRVARADRPITSGRSGATRGVDRQVRRLLRGDTAEPHQVGAAGAQRPAPAVDAVAAPR